jgi:hypothetical protein
MFHFSPLHTFVLVPYLGIPDKASVSGVLVLTIFFMGRDWDGCTNCTYELVRQKKQSQQSMQEREKATNRVHETTVGCVMCKGNMNRGKGGET